MCLSKPLTPATISEAILKGFRDHPDVRPDWAPAVSLKGPDKFAHPLYAPLLSEIRERESPLYRLADSEKLGAWLTVSHGIASINQYSFSDGVTWAIMTSDGGETSAKCHLSNHWWVAGFAFWRLQVVFASGTYTLRSR